MGCTRCVNGIIKTGNNDLPCICSKGDTALFSYGEGTITGAEIKHRNGLPQMPSILADRTEYGHFFRWHENPGFWHSTSGQVVIVVPPKKIAEPWLIILPEQDKSYEIIGHRAEAEAFAGAETYTRQ